MLIAPRQPSQQAILPLYSAAACAQLDGLVIAAGTPGFKLMQKAARSAWQLLEKRWPKTERINVFCGGGNNGGDGLLLALYAAQAGYPIRLWLAVDPNSYTNEAALAWQEVAAYGLQPETSDPCQIEFTANELLVDALLGIGLKGEVRGQLKAWIKAINSAPSQVFALDTPSGLLVDTGQLAGTSVEADLTLTFIALKAGLFTGLGVDASGEVVLSDLGISASDWSVVPLAYLQQNNQTSPLPMRKKNNHKGSHGRLLIIGGLKGMGGAALITAQAALRTGAGMVKVLTATEHLAAFLATQPEMMVEGLITSSEAKLKEQVSAAFLWADVLVIGPGLGQGDLAKQLWQLSFEFAGPTLVDADALNLWAKGIVPPAKAQRVITPHPGEAVRLLKPLPSETLDDRLALVSHLANKTQSVALLKGAGSLVVDYSSSGARQPIICPFGNPGMGVAGMGDLLSGCIAALMAQGLTAYEAAQEGMRIHALAGDRAAADQPRGLLPTDLLPFLRELVN
ncbi:bifunctional ADP-dependent NAD(P)H-hydrate dehydratase/NAD(P)H-hydrate epimerase [Marinospirillum insulare]|uniref:Bifunctional NAD(P)H-hydrate repair enzyme n=1 Tax=Marinospirillum insulare TaxID=217169 RepID=A0ABQ5ZU43_9GAMM|nr:bifunctional ADP-dependent NAD(P)H-hydrate dehydratase/NAD(P)H-hydrate epimerase [Marinospirillum insulare]GLR63654.1 bifunctional NAD(P)H-hydrate repair enzyme [Marinospirillum insulare]